jgi:5'-nucleotidase
MKKPIQILLTNDDGIQSPGLWAAAGALSELGYVHVVAPREQFSGAGRSLLSTSDGIITQKQMQVNGKLWTVYSVGGTPAQAVLHAIYEILPEPPDLVVSGINYGENPGTGITASGTVGAALEAASNGIRSIAISLETDLADHLSYSTAIDFSAAAFFTSLFGRMMLERQLPEDVDLLKVDVPFNAKTDTPWEVTRLSRQAYFLSVTPKRVSWDQPEKVGYRRIDEFSGSAPDTDIYALRVKHIVTVTPLSLDLTSRVILKDFERLLRGDES